MRTPPQNVFNRTKVRLYKLVAYLQFRSQPRRTDPEAAAAEDAQCGHVTPHCTVHYGLLFLKWLYKKDLFEWPTFQVNSRIYLDTYRTRAALDLKLLLIIKLVDYEPRIFKKNILF